MLLHYFGVSAINIMHAMPIVFALLEMLIAYYLVKYIVDSKLAGLLAMFFIAVSSGNIARTAALVYRGDSFISLFLMLALLLMLMALESGGALFSQKNALRRIMLKEHIGADLVGRHISEEKALAQRHRTEMKIIKGHERAELEKFAAMHKEEERKLLAEHLGEEELYYKNAKGAAAHIDEKREATWLKPVSYIIASAFVLSLGVVVWTGSPYIVAVYMLALLLLLIYAFIAGDEHLALMNVLLSMGLLLAYAFERLWMLVHFAPLGITLTGSKFFVFYIPLLAGALIAWYLLKGNFRIAKDPISRVSLFGIIAVAALVLAFTVFLPYVNAMTSTVGIHLIPLPATITNTISYAVGQTTQELQRPTWAFLFGSFHVQIILAPLGVLLFIFVGHKVGLTRKHGSRISVNFSEGMLAMLAYLAVTAFLQYAAIRYNALFSIPIAIFAAYATYAIWVLLKNRFLTQKIVIAFIAVVFDILIAYELITKIYPLFATGLALLIFSAVLVNILLIYVFAYSMYAVTKSRMSLQNVFIGLMLALLIMNLYSTYVQSLSVTQADGINTAFLGAMAWMRNNTPANSTVLTMWPDGSVVEAWAQRQSYTDSVGGENASRIYPFASFLFNMSNESTAYIQKVHPDYIVARTFWFDEIGGVAMEGLVQNASAYGYDILTSLKTSRNSTASFYFFNSSSYRAEMIIENASGTPKLYAYIGNSGSPQLVPITRVLFYNASSYYYSITNTSTRPALNETLMLSYAHNGISGATILGPKLLGSNIFKLVYLCNYGGCPYSGPVRMRDIYMNNDTRIIKVYYNTTNSTT
ncbi:MAG: hypothetical protein QXR73_02075, partial [Candidatus Micrarchaeaceae archaeon]